MRTLLAISLLAFTLSACALHDETGARLVGTNDCKTAQVVHDYNSGSPMFGSKWCYNRVADGGELAK